MDKFAINNVKQKGFDSRAQMRYLLILARDYPEKYKWVFKALRDHGVPEEEGPKGTYWYTIPEGGFYNVTPSTPSYKYKGKKRSKLETEKWRKAVGRFDKVINSKITKIAKQIEASYIDEMVRLFEGKNQKFSSIEEALSDFSERLGLTNVDVNKIKKQAMKKLAQTNPKMLRKLEQEGITDPKAIEFMSKSKGKHTDDTESPFVLKDGDEKEINNKINRKKEELSKDRPSGDDDQKNEFTSNVSTEGNSFAAQIIRLKRYAQQFGKLLDLKTPSLEKMEELQKELGAIDIDTPFQSSRFGFKFTDLDGKFPKPGKPVKVTAYQYSFLKNEIVKTINENLRNQLNEEMPLDQWIEFINQKVQSQEVTNTMGWKLVDELEKMKRQLYGDIKTKPFVIDDSGKYISQKIKEIMRWFPVSYRRQILRMLAAGEYRHLLSEASGKEAFATTYRRGSFVMMDSFAPYESLKIEPTTEQKEQLLKAVVTSGKNQFGYEDFIQLLDQLQIKYYHAPSDIDYQTLPLHSRVKIRVENKLNSSYKPFTYEKEVVDIQDKEKLLQSLHNKLMVAVENNLPLAYAPQSDGSTKEVRLDQIGKTKTDYTLSQIQEDDQRVNNPKAGLHPIFQGNVEQRKLDMGIGDLLKPRIKPEEKKEKAYTIDLDEPEILEPEESKTPPKSTGLSPDAKQKLLDLIRKKSSKLYYKVAQIMGMWMDSKGRSHQDENQLKDALLDEMIDKSENEVTNKAAEQALGEIPSGTPTMPTIEKQEEPLAVAASIKQKLTKVILSVKASESKVKLAKLIRKL